MASPPAILAGRSASRRPPLSFHLKEMTYKGLLSQSRFGQSVYYRAVSKRCSTRSTIWSARCAAADHRLAAFQGDRWEA